MLRKTIFWFHLATAVTIGVIVILLAATGVLMTYQKQLQSWADLRGLNGAPPVAGAAVLPTAQLVNAAQAKRAGKPSAVRWRSDVDAPVEVIFGNSGSVFINAYTGAVLGNGADGLRDFFRKVGGIHSNLALSGSLRPIGAKVVTLSNFAFLFLIISGFFLWWPRNWSASAVRNALWFRRGLRSKARDFNWHNVIGFWSLVPLFIIVATAVIISYSWAGNLVYRAVGEDPPTQAETRPAKATPLSEAVLSQIDPLVARAMRQDDAWRSITMQLSSAAGGITFSVDRGPGGQPQKRGTLVLNAGTSEVVKWEPFNALSTGQRLRSIIRFAHTGEVGGFAGQTLAGLFSGGVLFLAYTGLALALRRFIGWRRRETSGGASPDDLRPTHKREGGKAAARA